MKFSAIQYTNTMSGEYINVGIVIHNDEEDLIFLPMYNYEIHSYIFHKDSKEFCTFLSEYKETKKLLPFISLSKKQSFPDISRYGVKTAENYLSVIIGHVITIECFRRVEIDIENTKTQFDAQRISLDFQIDGVKLYPSSDDELIGLNIIKIDINYAFCYDEVPEYVDEEALNVKIGYVELFITNNMHYNICDTLDNTDKTEHFIHLFERNGRLKEEFLASFNYCNTEKEEFHNYGEFINRHIIISEVSLDENYRGYKIFPKIYKEICSVLNIDEFSIVLFKSFNEDPKKEAKLSKYYESIGFNVLETLNDGHIHFHNPAYLLDRK